VQTKCHQMVRVAISLPMCIVMIIYCLREMIRFYSYLITVFSSIFFWCGGFLAWETFGGEISWDFGVSWNLREGFVRKPTLTPAACLVEEMEDGGYLVSASCIIR